MSSKCPVCKTEITTAGDERIDPTRGIKYKYPCRRCGDFWLWDDFGAGALSGVLQDDPQKIAQLSHWIRTKHESMREGAGKDAIVLTEDLVGDIIKNPRPSVAEQANNFVRWVGDSIKIFDEYVDVDMFAIPATVGSATFDEFVFVFGYLRDQGVIQHKTGGGDIWVKARLSVPGWERYQELKLGRTDSRRAFMAMQYDNRKLDKIVENVFKPAVEQTGFKLFILRDVPKAGLIDDRLRVEIRISRFLIADLTDENRGAYWEAGYAEGLGKQVIYTCEKKKFESCKTHFDTNHHLTVLWDSERPEDVAKELKNTIRATFPAEAKLTDD